MSAKPRLGKNMSVVDSDSPFVVIANEYTMVFRRNASITSRFKRCWSLQAAHSRADHATTV